MQKFKNEGFTRTSLRRYITKCQAKDHENVTLGYGSGGRRIFSDKVMVQEAVEYFQTIILQRYMILLFLPLSTVIKLQDYIGCDSLWDEINFLSENQKRNRLAGRSLLIVTNLTSSIT